jgi:hypothetical protein
LEARINILTEESKGINNSKKRVGGFFLARFLFFEIANFVEIEGSSIIQGITNSDKKLSNN